MFLSIDLALFFNQYVTGIAINAISYWYYVVYCIWIALEAAFVWYFYVETKNTPLEEIARHFDGDQALVGGSAATAKGRDLDNGAEADESGMRQRRSDGDDEKAMEERRENAGSG